MISLFKIHLILILSYCRISFHSAWRLWDLWCHFPIGLSVRLKSLCFFQSVDFIFSQNVFTNWKLCRSDLIPIIFCQCIYLCKLLNSSKNFLQKRWTLQHFLHCVIKIRIILIFCVFLCDFERQCFSSHTSLSQTNRQTSWSTWIDRQTDTLTETGKQTHSRVDN